MRSLLSARFDTTVHGLGAALRCLALQPRPFASSAPIRRKRSAFEEAVRLPKRRSRHSFARRRATSSSAERRSPKARKC